MPNLFHKIAIIGAGFCGVALAWNLLRRGAQHVTLFDPKGIGGGTSGIAAGLMHPYAGAHAKRNWQGVQGYLATCELLKVSSDAIGEPVSIKTGLLRLAITEEQKTDFALCATKYSDVQWWNADKTQTAIPEIAPQEGLFIQDSITVDCKKYLNGLWIACERLGAQFEKRAINNLSELDHFDTVVVAAGAATRFFPEWQHLPITPVKGQVLELVSKELLSLPINSHAYVAIAPGNTECVAGASYERSFTSLEPDLETAISDILPKVQLFLPHLTRNDVAGCRAGVRASTPDHRPIATQINKKYWALTGMGSKGLLYHALFADQLSRNLLGLDE